MNVTTRGLRAVTETADTRADTDQLAMAQLRHSLVATMAAGGDLLDVACGSGYALPLVASKARSVTACDREPDNVEDARAALPSATVFLGDAEHLDLPASSFDVVACCEAIYYFHHWRGFIRDAVGLLRPGGHLLVTWPNPDRPAFSSSPGSTVYPSVPEMLAVADESGMDGECHGAFPFAHLSTARRPWLGTLRTSAIRLHLIPSSMRLRMVLKRLLYRRMTPLGELSLLTDPHERMVALPRSGPYDVTMFYFIGRRRG